MSKTWYVALTGGLAVFLLVIVGHLVVILASLLLEKDWANELPPIILAAWEPTRRQISKYLDKFGVAGPETEAVELHGWLWTALTAATVILAIQSFIGFCAGAAAGQIAYDFTTVITGANVSGLEARFVSVILLCLYPVTMLIFIIAGRWIYSNTRLHFALAIVSCAFGIAILNLILDLSLSGTSDIMNKMFGPLLSDVKGGNGWEALGAIIGFSATGIIIPILCMLVGALIGRLTHSRSLTRVTTAFRRLLPADQSNIQSAILAMGQRPPEPEVAAEAS